MKTLDYTTIDKSAWGDGPWQTEVDKRQWQDEATGLPCLIMRNVHLGFLCGYVGVSRGHPLYGKGYDDAGDIDVHGGLMTFAAVRGEDDGVWWFGFDTGHAGDLTPGTSAGYKSEVFGLDVYRDFAYVTAEVQKLAQQLAASK